jgi:hypothetical protein
MKSETPQTKPEQSASTAADTRRGYKIPLRDLHAEPWSTVTRDGDCGSVRSHSSVSEADNKCFGDESWASTPGWRARLRTCGSSSAGSAPAAEKFELTAHDREGPRYGGPSRASAYGWAFGQCSVASEFAEP